MMAFQKLLRSGLDVVASGRGRLTEAYFEGGMATGRMGGGGNGPSGAFMQAGSWALQSVNATPSLVLLAAMGASIFFLIYSIYR
jgi:hypothetical protein